LFWLGIATRYEFIDPSLSIHMKKFIAFTSVLSALIGVFVWITGWTDIKAMMRGVKRVVNPPDAIEEAYERDRQRYQQTQIDRIENQYVTVAPQESGGYIVQFHMPTNIQGKNVMVASLFELPSGQLLGPSEGVRSTGSLMNREATIFALNHRPETKSCVLFLFLRTPNGSMKMIKDANRRIAAILPDEWQEDSTYFLRCDQIEGRVLTVQTLHIEADAKKDRVAWFTVALDENEDYHYIKTNKIVAGY